MMRPAGAMVPSSPGREKLPVPGLARILAGIGSRSRGRPAARSVPMFSSRNKSVGRSSSVATQVAVAAAAVGEEGEPCSPKVTCIGQVRIRNKKSASRPSTRQPKDMAPCQCFHKALFCSLLPARKKPKGGGGCRSLWPRWASLRGRSGRYQRREPDSPKAPPLEFIVINADGEDEEEEHKEDARLFAAARPPKNALLLMRCRSAPHNSESSLATTARYAVSPIPVPKPGEVRKQKKKKKKKTNERLSSPAAAAELAEDEDEEEEEEEEEEEGGTGSESQRPLVLTRSRSEPVRRRRSAAA
ncbi:hypothetical protein B296_00024890 [Ensete ventricosum]|uniref:Uncharacterized protein n=1 Tax=Ensete ventricosum TaxID=4639 RepID=A0A426ZKW3_ENSVE|nr:hypothetical protein B296_00024890 [Ensete ventricosum]